MRHSMATAPMSPLWKRSCAWWSANMGLWCKSQSALAFVADSVRERPVSRAFWQKQISTLLFQLNDLHQNHLVHEKFFEAFIGRMFEVWLHIFNGVFRPPHTHKNLVALTGLRSQ